MISVRFHFFDNDRGGRQRSSGVISDSLVTVVRVRSSLYISAVSAVHVLINETFMLTKSNSELFHIKNPRNDTCATLLGSGRRVETNAYEPYIVVAVHQC